MKLVNVFTLVSPCYNHNAWLQGEWEINGVSHYGPLLRTGDTFLTEQGLEYFMRDENISILLLKVDIDTQITL